MRDDSKEMKVTYPPYAHALAGAGAGLSSVVLLHPLDTIRTHMQSSHLQASANANGRPQSMMLSLRQVIAHQGISSLYRGLFPASLGSVLSWAFYFHFFQRGRAVIAPYFPSHPTAAHLTSGVFAGIVTSVATNPIWVVKVRLQLQPTLTMRREHARPYDGFFDGLLTIVREEGVYGLYRGLSPSLWLVSHGALQFTLYEGIKNRLRHNRMDLVAEKGTSQEKGRVFISKEDDTEYSSLSDTLFASTLSKLIASVSTYPLQVARTRMQERMACGESYGSFFRTLWHIARFEGARGLYGGVFANILRVTPQAALTFITYEKILDVCSTRGKRD